MTWVRFPSPAPAVTNVIPASADEVVTFDLPGIDGRPEEKPEVPQPPVVEPEQPSVPEVPAPPVYLPEITSEVTYNATSYENVIVKQSEVNNVLALANINITKTTVTKEDGVPVSSIEEVVSPVLVGSVDNTLGVKEVVYTTAGSSNTWSFNINVVKDSAIVSADRGLAIYVDNPSAKITQSQAKAMTKVEDFINLNQVTGVNAQNENQVIVIPNQQTVLDVVNAKVGVHAIEYGIDATSTLNEIIRSKFIASATIEVEFESNVDESDDGIVNGLVDYNQLKDETGNQTTKEEITVSEDTLQQGGLVYQGGVKTGINSQLTIVALLSTVAVSLITLFGIAV